VKFYFGVKGTSVENSEAKLNKISTAFMEKVNNSLMQQV
jgi:hypothetical protein